LSRRRKKRELSWEEQRAAAKLERERAEDALRYRKSQLADAESELVALAGPGGWFAAIVGKKAAYEAEAQAKIKALKTETLALRKRLIEARQAEAKFERSAKQRDQQAHERDAELEVFADRVRQTHSHSIYEALQDLEERIQVNADKLFEFDDAMYACSGLSASIGQVIRATGSAKTWASMDAFSSPIPGSNTLTFLRTRQINKEAATVPQAIERFNLAIGKLGLSPMDIEIPDLDSGWESLLFDNIITDLHNLNRLEGFARRIEDERDMIRETMLWVATQRKAVVDDQAALIAARRKLLDEALG